MTLRKRVNEASRFLSSTLHGIENSDFRFDPPDSIQRLAYATWIQCPPTATTASYRLKTMHRLTFRMRRALP